ncbi:MAG: hypothetical protein ACOY90_16270 [Candidatus Zhuqueibacterota bacterium]
MKSIQMTVFILIVVFMTMLVLTPNYAQEKAASGMAINEHLKPLLPFIGKTWKGEFANSTPEKPMIDVQSWELILNGQAIRIMHSVNDGAYGGESIIVWDAQKESLVYFYFTTAGFYTQGTFSFDGEKYISHEFVTGNAQGITEVKGIGEILADGRMRSSSQYLQQGAWVDGHTIHYVEDASARPVFK